MRECEISYPSSPFDDENEQCHNRASYKITFTNKAFNGVIQFVCSSHISLFRGTQENDGCLIESLIRTTDPDMLVYLDTLEKNALTKWFKIFIHEKGLESLIINIESVDNGTSQVAMNRIIENFEKLDCSKQNQIKHIINKVELRKGDIRESFINFAEKITKNP